VGLSALAAVIVAGVRYGLVLSDLAELERKMADLQPRRERLAPVISQIEIFLGRKATHERKRALVTALQANTFPEGLLARLRDTSPALMSLDRIVVESRDAGTVAVQTPEGRRLSVRGAQIEITGRADGAGSATEWGRRLEELGLVERLEVTNDSDPGDDGAGAVEFRLSGRLSPSASEATDNVREADGEQGS
jgi:hypothetical protein